MKTAFLHATAAAFAALLAASANAGSLYWSGGTDGTWNASNANWTNASGTATAWVRGSDAVIDASVTRSIPVKGPVHADNIFFRNGNKAITLGDAGTLSWQGWALQENGSTVSFSCPLTDETGNGLHFDVRGTTYLRRKNTHTGGTYIKNGSSSGIKAFAINGATYATDNPNGEDWALGAVPETVQTNIYIKGGNVALFVDASFTNTVHKNRTILVENGNTFFVSPNGELRIKGSIMGANKPGTEYPTETRLFFHNNWSGKTVLYGTNQIGRIHVTGRGEIADGKTTYISAAQATGDNAGLKLQGNGSAYNNTRGYLLVSGGTLANFQSGYRSQTMDYGHLDIAGGAVSIESQDSSEFLNALGSPGKVTIRDGGRMMCRKFRITQVANDSATSGGEVFLEEGGTLRVKWLWVDFSSKRKGKVHFNGGALQSIAGNSNTSVTLSPTTNTWEGTDFVVEAGGAVFDTANGQHLWFGRPLLTGVAAGETDGGLTCKLGSGRSVILHDCITNSTYNGPTRIEAIGTGTSDRTLQCRVANALPATTTLQIGPTCWAGFSDWASGNARQDLAQTVSRVEGTGKVIYNSLLTVTDAVAPVFDGAYGTLAFQKAMPQSAFTCDLEISGDASGCGCVKFETVGQSIAGLTLKVSTIAAFDKDKGKTFYKIVDAPNGFSGEFASTNLPDHWRVTYSSTAAYLAPINPFMMIVR